MVLSVIIPAYNEENTIELMIRKVKEVALPGGITKEVIVINDGSTDRTEAVLDKFKSDSQLKIFHQNPNAGKAAALKKGIESAQGDIILIQDADLEYDPSQYPQLIGPILNQGAEIVYGSRFLGKIEKMKWINRISNDFSNLTFNLLFGTRLTDLNTCFKVFRKDVLKDIKLSSQNFQFETEITAKLVRKGYNILEVPISYEARTAEQGKKITWGKACQMYWGIFKFRF